VHHSIEEYSKALSFYKRSLEIKQINFPSNHLCLAICCRKIAQVDFDMGDYLNALSFIERDIDIAQRSLSANHPDLQKYKSNLEIIQEKL